MREDSTRFDRIFPKHEVNWVFLTGEVRAAGAHPAGAPYWGSPSSPAQRDISAGGAIRVFPQFRAATREARSAKGAKRRFSTHSGCHP